MVSQITPGSGILPQVADFLNPSEIVSFSLTKKDFKEAVNRSLEYNTYTRIRSFAPNTYLGKLVLKHPLENTPTGQAKLVKRVWSEALTYMKTNKNTLQEVDWIALGIELPARTNANFPKNLSFDQLNLAGERIQTNLRDTALERTFTEILKQIPPDEHPQLNGNLSERAEIIRNWMGTHQAELDQIINLNLRNLNLSYLPEEITQLTNLESLNLSGNPITHLPENFNPQQLRIFWLDKSPITHLPENFNPPQLRIFWLDKSPITYLPENFNPPQLRNFSLCDTAITHLPENFNPQELRMLSLDDTQITHLPENFNPPHMNPPEWFSLRFSLRENQIKSIAKQAWTYIRQNPARCAAVVAAALSVGFYHAS